MLVNSACQAIWYALIFFAMLFFFSGRDAEETMTSVPGGRNCADWERLSEPDEPDLDHVLAQPSPGPWEQPLPGSSDGDAQDLDLDLNDIVLLDDSTTTVLGPRSRPWGAPGGRRLEPRGLLGTRRWLPRVLGGLRREPRGPPGPRSRPRWVLSCRRRELRGLLGSRSRRSALGAERHRGLHLAPNGVPPPPLPIAER